VKSILLSNERLRYSRVYISENHLIDIMESPAKMLGTLCTLIRKVEESEREASGSSDSHSLALRSPKCLGSTLFSEYEQEALWQLFRENQYPSKEKLVQLSNQFNIPLGKIRTWFNNRRSKGSRKKESKDVLMSPNNAVSSQQTQKLSEKSPQATIISKTTLKIGSWMKYSVSFENSQLLEVKFLYGRRKIRYEVFLGSSVIQAAAEGGPYGCIDVPFGAIKSLTFEGKTDQYLRVQVNPEQIEFYLQPVSNFMEYKKRTKQRMYVSSPVGDFSERKVASESSEHVILVPSAQVASLRTKLIESFPHLEIQRAERCSQCHSTKLVAASAVNDSPLSADSIREESESLKFTFPALKSISKANKSSKSPVHKRISPPKPKLTAGKSRISLGLIHPNLGDSKLPAPPLPPPLEYM